MRRFFAAIITICISLGISQPASSQSQVQVNDPRVEYSFGGTLTIEAEINSEIPIQNIRIHLQSDTSERQIIEQIPGTSTSDLFFSMDLSQTPLPVFSNVEYWFHFELEGGQISDSQKFSFQYEDNRFPWQSIETEEFAIHWYEGDSEFGERILNFAYEGLARLGNQVSIPAPKKITYYVYASSQEMQSTLQLSGQNAGWIAGHAEPTSGVILVSITPGPADTLEIKRQIPHELAHVMLYQKLGQGYQNLPIWLSEGLASTVELFPNPDYPALLEIAYQQGALLQIADLCQGFPTDASNFLLAYAESTSFVWYLQGEFGISGMETLLNSYANGIDCNRGVEIAFEKNLQELERDWRRLTLNENPLVSSFMGFLPWLIVFTVLMLPSMGLVITDTIKRRKSTR
jgi:hypothetical protein